MRVAAPSEVPPDLLGLAMFRPQQASELLRAYPGELALAWDGDRAVGVLGYCVEGGGATILHIGVDAAWRRRGVGRALVDWLAGWGDTLVADTVAPMGAGAVPVHPARPVIPCGRPSGTQEPS
ncbi:MAG TPA: GNAT family N-acetyltransferase [Bacillota bacterium]|nr:GNAT family N-acetyltransferase [Bacillota bacterium]